jgi:hypothetical protein
MHGETSPTRYSGAIFFGAVLIGDFKAFRAAS